ncbi:hypothetical protein [Streptomyces sp. CBMA156]|uniref:hypothetical protein n=1 Tax=Streptomyces sp. CBMA156 TaxID=1930280 RepID=UPI0016619A41|nr:hypothetical protein [Streptomyces sp. CBMA156]MBD0671671.1 hypothetical protein [Streptomyces sp. CBMA156]
MARQVRELGFGRLHRSASVIGVPGLLWQLGRRFVLVFGVVLLVGLVVMRPDNAVVKAAIVVAIIVAVYGLVFAWRRLAGRLGIRQCHLHEDGVAVTDFVGGVRDAVAWRDLATVREINARGVLAAFRRFEFRHRTGHLAMAVVVPSVHRAFAKDLIRLANEKIGAPAS